KAVSISRPVGASRTSICFPMDKAAALTSETNDCVRARLLGSTSTPTRTAPGCNSCNNPSCFAPSSATTNVTPVTLPPGRLRLATRPSLTGSGAACEDDRDCCSRRLGYDCRGGVSSDHRHLTAHQIGCEVGQSVGLVLRPPILERHILALDVAGFTNALLECGQKACTIGRRPRTEEEPDYRHRRLLRAHRERPGG